MIKKIILGERDMTPIISWYEQQMEQSGDMSS